jgi:S-formylglutathione hydrolase FrmB
MTSEALAKSLIGDPTSQDYYVYLPPGYNTNDNRYPVVYVLHGYGLDAEDLGDELSTLMNNLISLGQVRPMILVFPDANTKFGGDWYMSSPTVGDYEGYLTRELVTQIDASYRTLPNRESRGISGCSCGGFGSLYLALKYPNVFSVAAPMSGLYDWEHNGMFEQAQAGFTHEPKDWNDLENLDGMTEPLIALAAVAAPNPNKPPFFLDMPFQLVNGKPQIVPEVYQKINALDPVNDLRSYLKQSVRLRGLMIYQDTDEGDPYNPAAMTGGAIAFDKTLTQMGVAHDFLELTAQHCMGSWTPILKFMDAHLAF